MIPTIKEVEHTIEVLKDLHNSMPDGAFNKYELRIAYRVCKMYLKHRKEMENEQDTV